MSSESISGALIFSSVVTIIGLIVGIGGKLFVDTRTRQSRARSMLAAAMAELGAEVAELERLNLVDALLKYQRSAEEGKLIPLVVDLPKDRYPVSREAVKVMGDLNENAARILAQLLHCAIGVETTMRSIQLVFDSPLPTLTEKEKVLLIGTLYGTLAVQVKRARDMYRVAEKQLSQHLRA